MNERKRLEFEKALEQRNFEISNFWIRGWFFGALILATITGYFTNATLDREIIPSVCISLLIFLFSLAQSLMNRGSKYWQERWEYITKNRESVLKIDVTKTAKYNNSEKYYLDRSIRSKNENILARGQRFSVSKLAFLVWDIITISAFLFWLNDIFYPRQCNCNPNKVILFHIVIFIYIGFFWLNKGYVFENIAKTKKGDIDNLRENELKNDCVDYVENKIKQ